MKNVAFTDAMNQIAAEAESLQQREEIAARRRQLYAKARGWVAGLLWAAFLGCGFYYHHELQQFFSEKFLAQKPRINGTTGAALKSIEAQAAKRDAVLDEVTAPK
ncbi:MAG: hypothetical protein EPO07_07855 [Verrucomicrobia bacterium]|nr:MAG: hypothetical protein EPO07_07855 [Verrucomicrobiota bacterium]